MNEVEPSKSSSLHIETVLLLYQFSPVIINARACDPLKNDIAIERPLRSLVWKRRKLLTCTGVEWQAFPAITYDDLSTCMVTDATAVTVSMQKVNY